jgi:flagellar hook-basal body complex protein FliE
VFQSLVEQTSALDAKASATVSGLLSGQGVDIHDAMIATEKADMAFELALQVRNKAVGAYQQMMGMQF